MYDTILVPLDGSSLAEAALPMAQFIAKAFKSRIILFHVVEENPPADIHGEHHLAGKKEAEAYLGNLAVALRTKRTDGAMDISFHVDVEKDYGVTGGIVEHLEELKPDLVVMCSHGRGGLKHALIGSIAARVTGRGSVPVLLVRSEWKQCRHPEFSQILVALDSASVHDTSIETAVEVAKATGSNLSLLTVVPTFATLKGKQAAPRLMLPGTTQVVLEMEEKAMNEHLRGHLEELNHAGLQARAYVWRGDAARQIAKASNKLDTCLVVLGTHGKAGLGAFWANSVAAKVASLTDKPLLLLPMES